MFAKTQLTVTGVSQIMVNMKVKMQILDPLTGPSSDYGTQMTVHASGPLNVRYTLRVYRAAEKPFLFVEDKTYLVN